MTEQPIEVLKGSKLPGDLSSKLFHKLGFRIHENHALKVPFWLIDPRAFESPLPSKVAVRPKRLILPGQSSDGKVVCRRDASTGLAELHLDFGDEQIDLSEALKDWAYIDGSLAAHGGSTVSALLTGTLSLVTDNIPVWAEVSTVLAIVATIPRKRVRLLLEFKGDTDRQPMVIETADVIAVLLDHICRGGGDDTRDTADTEEIHVMF